jgi:hypothetical protein
VEKMENIDLVRIPCQPDEITLNLIKKAEMFKKHAISHAEYGSEIDCMIAIHNLDNCIEYLLRISIDFLKIETVEERTISASDISSLAGELNSYLKKYYQINLPHYEEIKFIRQIRNLVQHGMANPNTELKRIITITNRFFQLMLQKIFGITDGDISMAVLVKDKEIGKYLKDAEDTLNNGKYLESIILCRDAFENALFNRLQTIDFRYSSIPAIMNEQKNEYFIYFLENIADQLLTFQLNLNLKYYNKFKKYLEYIPLEYCKGGNVGRVLGREWNKNDAQFCYTYVCDEILKWQYEDSESIETGKFDFDFENKTTWKHEINSYKFETEGVCLFIFHSPDIMELIYITDEHFNDYNDIKIGNNYVYKTEVYQGDELISIDEKTIKLLGYRKKIITNNPARWEVVIWYEDLVLTTKRTEYDKGQVVKNPININNCTVEEIASLGEDEFNYDMATSVINYIKVIGGIKTLEDLRQIKGITDEQIHCIGWNTYI